MAEDADCRERAEEVALLASVEEAEDDIREGKLVSNEEMRSRIEALAKGRGPVEG